MQMRELLIRQTLGCGTFSAEILRQQAMEASPPQAETHTNDFMQSTSIQAQLQERARQSTDRQQQTRQAHRGLLSRSATPVIDMIFGGLRRRNRR